MFVYLTYGLMYSNPTEGLKLFDEMVNKINNSTVSTLMRGQIPVQVPEEVREAAPEPQQQPRYTESKESYDESTDEEARQAAARDTREQAPQPIVKEKVPGRNDPCPCGSGKKFKHCHGKGIV